MNNIKNETYNLLCKCSACTKYTANGILQNAQTFMRHKNSDNVSSIGPKDRDDYEDSFSIMSVETTGQQIPFLREDDVFDVEEESDVESSLIAADNEDSDSNDESSDEDETEIDGGNGFEQMMASIGSLKIHNMSQTSQFMAIFGVIFQAFYLVQTGGSAMLKFFHHLLVAFEKDADLPLTVNALKAMTGFDVMTKGIVKYTVCNKCFAIYSPDNHQPTCTFKKYSSTHTQICNNPIFTDPSARDPIPFMVFPYSSLKNTLTQYLCKPGFEDKMLQWRSRETVENTFLDIYDGAMWNELLDDNDMPFVDDDYSLMLTLNVDWFQPFDGRTHASGALYLSINNLPREERMKPENIILVGVMPGPKEAKTDQMNNFLEPLVDELVDFYTGMTIKTAMFPGGVRVRAALMCVACDIPAARKTAGFTGHASTNACHKCARQFSVIDGSSKIDYSGFDVENWTPREKAANAVHAEMWFNAESDVERAELEKNNGTRYSELHRLHYFDPVRCTIVDPMHNLFLGTAKRMISIWRDLGYFPSTTLARMQHLADSILVPPGYAVLSNKIASGFPYMKADEWRSWCLVYSLVVLENALPETDYNNWLVFVDACRLLTGPSVTTQSIDEAHQLLGNFGEKCEILYGTVSITPNMHLHMHLRESMLDFGPVYAFWLYSFERYNGKLKNIKTNRRNGFEVTFMKVFLEKGFISNFLQFYSAKLSPPMVEFLQEVAQIAPTPVRSLVNSEYGHPPYMQFNLNMFLQAATNPWFNVTGSEALPLTSLPLKLSPLSIMTGNHYKYLVEFYNKAYQDTGISFCATDSIPLGGHVYINDRIRKMKKISLLGQEYWSGEKKKRGSFVQVLFLDNSTSEFVAFPGQIEYLFTHVIKIGGIERVSTFAFVKWFPTYNAGRYQPLINQGLELWEKGFLEETIECIIPVHRLHSCFALTTHNLQQGSQKRLIIPLPRKVVT
ncbi:hypothetical protein INT47_006510 [Mucor saturninus]|uniref:Transposase domain-containing protein n=1 Tax=Mucor saturninus TaxID=64648 RepID=A0A8H7UPX0_9FUNG|nr:hypothetical protein INT47_006510 [Mucor saturninus]